MWSSDCPEDFLSMPDQPFTKLDADKKHIIIGGSNQNVQLHIFSKTYLKEIKIYDPEAEIRVASKSEYNCLTLSLMDASSLASHTLFLLCVSGVVYFESSNGGVCQLTMQQLEPYMGYIAAIYDHEIFLVEDGHTGLDTQTKRVNIRVDRAMEHCTCLTSLKKFSDAFCLNAIRVLRKSPDKAVFAKDALSFTHQLAKYPSVIITAIPDARCPHCRKYCRATMSDIKKTFNIENLNEYWHEQMNLQDALQIDIL